MEGNRALAAALALALVAFALVVWHKSAAPRDGGRAAGGAPPAVRPDPAPAPRPRPPLAGKDPPGRGVAGDPPLAVSPEEHDFGRIFDSARVRHVFQVANRRPERVTLVKITTSCGCTAAAPLRRGRPLVLPAVLEPQEQFSLPVEYDPTGRSGPHGATVELQTDHVANPFARARLKVQIQPEVAAERYQFFGTLSRGKEVERMLEIAGHPGETFRVTEATASVPYVEARILDRAAQREPGGPSVTRVALKLTGRAPVGRFEEKVFLRTTNPRHATIEIHVMGIIEGEIAASPERLWIGPIQPGERPAKVIFLRSRSLKVEVRAIACSIPWLVCRVLERRGNDVTLRVEVAGAPADVPEVVKGSIRIETNSTEAPVITVPVILNFTKD